MKKPYAPPAARAVQLGSEEDTAQLVTTSKGVETYDDDDDDDDDPATGPALVRHHDVNLWDEVW